MPFNVPAEVGELYDIGIETRDGSTLSCAGQNGTTQAISKMGYVCSTKRPQEESTELQEKAKITQFASAQASDREFDQWVQVTQGDWSGGSYQRVYAAGVAPGVVLASPPDASRYWDGEGIIWPLNDYVPQRLLPKPATTDVNGTTTGAIAVAAALGEFSWVYRDSNTNTTPFSSMAGDTKTSADISGTVGTAAPGDFFYFLGSYWLMVNNVLYVSGSAGAGIVAFATLPGVAVSCAFGQVGSQSYIAVNVLMGGANVNVPLIRLFNVTNVTGNNPPFPNNSFVDLKFDHSFAFGAFWGDMTFLADSLIVAVLSSNGRETSVLAYNIAAQSWSTLATLPSTGNARLQAVAGGLFILAASDNSFTPKIDMYLLQGASLQHIGPLVVQIGSKSFDFIHSLTKISIISVYAVWGLVVTDGFTTPFTVFAYDVIRGRLFKISQSQLAASENNVNALVGSRLAVSPSHSRIFSGITVLTSYNIVRPALITSGLTAPLVYELFMGVYQGSPASRVQEGFTCVSSQIDFTSAQPKLFRQLIAKFAPLPNDASINVTLDAWLDQDPAALSTVPQFTVTIAGNTSPNATQLVLPINTVGIKVVYRITITGGTAVSAGALVPAPKLTSVAIQSASGWAWHLFLDVADTTLTNGQSPEDYVYQRQGSDSLAAYNFLRQLWRLKGGFCKVTLPNGDSYNAVIQMMKSSSPKPYGSSFVASQPTGRWESVIELMIREDI